MNNKIIAGVVGAVVLVGASFYGGVAYEKSRGTPLQFGSGNSEQFQNRGMGAMGLRGGTGGGITAGEIISKDTTSITIKMQDGSTNIVLIGESTEVMKTEAGSLDDLSVGTSVTVVGTTNSDGSITGQDIQIRPIGAMPFGGMRTSQ